MGLQGVVREAGVDGVFYDNLRREPEAWVDLVEQAGLVDVCLVGEPAMTEVVMECVVAVGRERGLMLDPAEERELDEMGVTLLESARRKVLEAEGVWMETELERMAAVGPNRAKGRYR